MAKMNNQKGFTLIEIAIVLVIIGLLLGVIMTKGDAIIGNTKTTSTIALIKDLNAAINDFKNRYHYLPGDLPSAGDDIPAIKGTTCDIAPGGTIGNGLVELTESKCVAEELVQAGMIKGEVRDKVNNPLNGIYTPYNPRPSGDVFVLANSNGLSATFGTAYQFGTPNLPPVTVQNVIEIQNLPCDAAQAIDQKLDDGNLQTGNIRATACQPDNTMTLDIAL